MAELEANSRGPNTNSNEAYSTQVENAIIDSMNAYPGSRAAREAHLRGLLNAQTADGTYVFNQTGPMNQAIRNAIGKLPSEVDELRDQAVRESANQRTVNGFHATFLIDPKDGKLTVDDDKNELKMSDGSDVMEGNYHKFLIERYGKNSGDRYYNDYVETKNRLIKDGSPGDIEVYAKHRESIRSATSPEERDKAWVAIKDDLGSLTTSMYNTLHNDAFDETKFDEDKTDDAFDVLMTDFTQKFWLDAGMGISDPGTGAFIGLTMDDDDPLEDAVVFLAGFREAMSDEYEAWYRDDAQKSLRDEDLDTYRTARKAKIKEIRTKWLGGYDATTNDYTKGKITEVVADWKEGQTPTSTTAPPGTPSSPQAKPAPPGTPSSPSGKP
mgnify:CR=1 FL=1